MDIQLTHVAVGDKENLSHQVQQLEKTLEALTLTFEGFTTLLEPVLKQVLPSLKEATVGESSFKSLPELTPSPLRNRLKAVEDKVEVIRCRIEEVKSLVDL